MGIYFILRIIIQHFDYSVVRTILTLTIGSSFKLAPMPFNIPHQWLSGKESVCQCRSHRRCKFHPWVRKIPWRGKWQPTPVF